jgi:hypothetical protein
MYVSIANNNNDKRKKSRAEQSWDNACCHSDQNIFASCQISKNLLRIEMYRSVILPVVWVRSLGCHIEAGNEVSRRVFWRQREGVTGRWRKLYNHELNNFTHHWILFSGLRRAENVERMVHTWVMHSFGWKTCVKWLDHLDDGIDLCVLMCWPGRQVHLGAKLASGCLLVCYSSRTKQCIEL